MNNEQEIERRLDQTPIPSVKEGRHRSQLKSELLAASVRERQAVEAVQLDGASRTPRLVRVAASVLIAVSLVAAGWSAEKVYQQITGKSSYVELEKPAPVELEIPDGKGGSESMTGVSSVFTLIPEEAPPGSREKAERHHQEMKRLIADKKYILIKTTEDELGVKQYLYQFTLADGEQTSMNFTMPLEGVSSWEDYLQKKQKQQRDRHERVSAAIADGNYRLLDVEPITIHVCKEAGSDENLLVQRIDLAGGRKVASVRRESSPSANYQTSWPDHLKSVRVGNRQLIRLEVVNNYTYEITMDDGSKTLFTYGGHGTLEELGR